MATDWDIALDRLGELVRGATGQAVMLASGRASTESLGLVRRLLDGNDVTAAVKVPLGDEAPLAGVPNLALRRERAPNLDGARLLGYTHRLGRRDPRRARVPRWSSCSMPSSTEADAAALAAARGAVVVLGTVVDRALRTRRSWSCRSPPWRRRTGPT